MMPTMDDLAALEYPRMLHRPSVPGAWVTLVVGNVSECAAALAAGWSLDLIIIRAEPLAEPPRDEVLSQPVASPTAEPPRRVGGWPKGKPRKVAA
jgi:hypothetical protein